MANLLGSAMLCHIALELKTQEKGIFINLLNMLEINL